MGKNSHARDHVQRHADDVVREREADAKKEARRLKAETRLEADGLASAMGAGVMDMDASVASAAAEEVRKKVKFGKVRLGKSAKLARAERRAGKGKKGKERVAPLRASLTGGKRGIRKPSALMRKTLKKLAKKREMDLC